MKLALLAPLTLLLLALAGRAQSAQAVLTARHLSKAETLVTQLESFDSLAGGTPDTRQYSARLGKLSASVGNVIGNFPESHIKANLETAVFFYEQVPAFSSSRASEPVRCLSQRPGIYQRLCVNDSGSRRDFLLSKARLHVRWARAELTLQRGGAADTTVLREMEEQQRSDQELARQALAALKRLEGEVVVYLSLGEFEAEQMIARVPYETFQQHLQETVIEVRRTLSWLPRNSLRTELSNALSSYQDGAFWWERAYQPRVIKVTNLAAETNRAPIDTAYLETVPYTVVINWRNARRSLRRAEAILESKVN